MHFTKWNGCGNDFVFINAMHMDDLKPVLDKCERICDRHFGIGADGIIFILPSQKADLRMRIFNADGSEAEMCGNGIRCFARWAYELGLVSTRRFSVETGAGILYPEILDDHRVRVDMGAPHLEAAVVPTTGFSGNPVVSEELVSSTGSHYKVTCVSMGNPHCVIFTDNVPDNEFLKKEGSAMEKDVHFPRKTNVEFVHPLGNNRFRMRVWERGTGITMACGTGCCATAVAAILNGLAKDEAYIDVDGGTLHISWKGGDSHVFMTGPAAKAFEGDFTPELI